MNESAKPPRPRAPWHLWVVGILSLLWNSVGAYDYLMTQTKNAAYMSQFTPRQLEYYYGFPAWVVSAWAIAVWGAVAGSLLLLLRRGLAFPVFAVAFAAYLVTTFYNYVLSPGLEIMGGVGPVVFGVVIGVIALLLTLYARSQKKSGVLA